MFEYTHDTTRHYGRKEDGRARPREHTTGDQALEKKEKGRRSIVEYEGGGALGKKGIDQSSPAQWSQ